MDEKYLNLNTIQNVGESEKRLEKLIVTNDDATLFANEGEGNIIVKIGNGKPLNNNEESGTTYTSLYVGDEHIATGFGFANTNQRDNVLTDISYLKEKIDSIKNSSGSDNSDDSNSNNITVQFTKNKIIKTDKIKYVFSAQNNQINIQPIQNPVIKESTLFYKDLNNALLSIKDNNIQYFGLDNKFNFAKLNFIFEGYSEITKIYLTYRQYKGITEIDTQNYTKLFELSDIELKTSSIVNKQYLLNDPDAPDVYVLQSIDLIFTEEQLEKLESIKKEGFFDIRLNVETSFLGNEIIKGADNNNYHKIKNIKISKSIANICVVKPFFAIIENEGTLVSDKLSESTGLQRYLPKLDSSSRISFNHSTTQHREILYIPSDSMGNGISNVMCTLEQTNMQYKWNNIDNGAVTLTLENNQKHKYNVFYSPNEYLGNVVWLVNY